MPEPASMKIKSRALPFTCGQGPLGILIIHGLGGTPDDYRQYAADLARLLPATVHVMRLAGHGADPIDLHRTPLEDWRQSVEVSLTRLAAKTQQQVVIGVSFGAIMALDAALHTPALAGVITINAAWSYRTGGKFQAVGLRILRLFTKYFPKPGLSAEDRQRYTESGSLTKWPIRAITESRQFADQAVIPKLSGLQMPLLVLASEDDAYVDPRSIPASIRNLHHLVEQDTIPIVSHRPFRDEGATTWITERTAKFIRGHCLESGDMV